MTKPHSLLETTRREAQDLHRKISANLARAEHATWAEVIAAQADAAALAARMKTLAGDQADTVKDGLVAAVARLESGCKLAETRAGAVKGDVRLANDKLLHGAHRAARSLSAALAAARARAAHALASGRSGA